MHDIKKENSDTIFVKVDKTEWLAIKEKSVSSEKTEESDKKVDKIDIKFHEVMRNRPCMNVNNSSDVPLVSSGDDISTSTSSTTATPTGIYHLPIPYVAIPPVTNQGSQIFDLAPSLTANRMTAQMQFNQFPPMHINMGDEMRPPMHMNMGFAMRPPMYMNIGFGMRPPMPMNMGINMNFPFATALNMCPPVIPLIVPTSTVRFMSEENIRYKQSLFEKLQSFNLIYKRKKFRTIILPEQLNYLYKQYKTEIKPTGEMLRNMAHEVGLSERVVRIWFKNRRARDRKDKLRVPEQVNHMLCAICNMIFKDHSTLESHIATRHANHYNKDYINTDALPNRGDSKSVEPESPNERKIRSPLQDSFNKESTLDQSKPLKKLNPKCNGNPAEKVQLQGERFQWSLVEDARSDTESTDNMDV